MFSLRISLFFLFFAVQASAVTFTVNSTADPGIGICDATDCTLREAILAANANPNSGGPDLINFAIPIGGLKTISPTSELPTITDPVVLDGTTQGGTNEVWVKVDGTLAGVGAIGLSISAGGSTIKGLSITRFGCDGIHISTGGGNKIQLNNIGVDPTATIAEGNGCTGVFIDGSPNNLIGGNAPGTENFIGANAFAGIAIGGSESVGNLIQGNFIGTDDTGTIDLGNDAGIYLGPTSVVHNGSSSQTTVAGNQGVSNTIAYNHFTGISILKSSTGNVVRANSIFSNSSIGIDHDNDGVTQIDSCDADAGGNLHQNFPVLTSVTIGGSNTIINGFLNSSGNTDFNLDFYSNSVAERQGRHYLGTALVTTDNSCNVNLSSIMLPAPQQGDQFITATATDPFGNTSEFSAVSAPAGVCTFEDFFNDNLMDWFEAIPSVTESSGFLILNPTRKKAVVLSPFRFGGCSYCVFTAEISLSGGPSQKASMLTHNLDKKNEIEILFKQASGKVIAKVKRNGSLVKRKGSVTLLPNTIYSVSLAWDGTNLTLSIDGNQILSFKPGGDIPDGGMGFVSKEGILSVDHVCIHQ